ncbi:MAG: serine hydrolase [Syntrophobacterales bacterium]|nr:serine hydrolase [Syntrophobacterales bacterium]
MTYIILFLALVLPFCLSANDSITAKSYILVEKDTFQVIAGRDYERKLPPASTTKVMTTILAIEKLDGKEMITPDPNVLKFPRSKLYLVPGNQYTSSDLMKGAMIESANDAAYTLGAYIGGSEEDFARIMTEKALAIGAENTNFKNASGLYVEGQYTTCYDLALIFKYALSSERFREIISTRYFLFHDRQRSTRYKNHNRFLFCFEPAIGGKTGFTQASKHCYVGAFEKDGKEYILSLLGSRDLWGDSVLLLKNLYEQLPSDREMRLAKAHSLVLTSYHEQTKKKPAAEKKHISKKKTGASKKHIVKRVKKNSKP